MPAIVGAFLLPSLAGTLTASVVGGAIVGAAIGGITAAITGGDIGKGLLFGAIGGAVTGAVSYGLGSVMESMKVGTNWASGETVGGIGKESLANQMSVTTARATGGSAHLVPEGTKVITEAGRQAGVGGSGFLSNLGQSLGSGFGQAAVGAGIGGIKDMYLAKKAGELSMSEAEKNRNLEREKIASAERIAGARSSSSGGGGGSGPDYTIDELIRRDREAAGHERTTVLAKVGAELNAQKALRRQEYAEAGAGRERMAAGAGVGTGPRTGSRSTTTLVALQDRIRSGENAQGDPNTGVIPPVKYVPPGQQEEQVA